MAGRVPSDESGQRLHGGASTQYKAFTLAAGTGPQAVELPAGCINVRARLTTAGKLYGTNSATTPPNTGYEVLAADTYNDAFLPCAGANYVIIAGDAGGETGTLQCIMGAE